MQMMGQVECNQVVKYVPLHTLFKPTGCKSGLQPMASASGTGGSSLLEHLRIAGYVTAGPARSSKDPSRPVRTDNEVYMRFLGTASSGFS